MVVCNGETISGFSLETMKNVGRVVVFQRPKNDEDLILVPRILTQRAEGFQQAGRPGDAQALRQAALCLQGRHLQLA